MGYLVICGKPEDRLEFADADGPLGTITITKTLAGRTVLRMFQPSDRIQVKHVKHRPDGTENVVPLTRE